MKMEPLKAVDQKQKTKTEICQDFATCGLLATDHAILNQSQVTWTTPLQTTTPTGERFSSRQIAALDCGLWWYWARTHDMPAMIRYLDHWATAALRDHEGMMLKVFPFLKLGISERGGSSTGIVLITRPKLTITKRVTSSSRLTPSYDVNETNNK
ncbi:hypothetical protein TNCV_1664121 [Trichonephila clavipes]|uniref:Uncharacterized protein n=1 Tax=Trichonephila clavipes TaxID=2585209 RepID=A0A8X6RWD7_TRICX|nr:hypothetical protein TNCV_1664121 [Trichonephila clavipes]